MVFSAFKTARSDDKSTKPRRRLPSAAFRPTPSISQQPEAKEGLHSVRPEERPSRPVFDAEPDLKELNNCLLALAEVFPDVRPEVFREMLSTFSGESRMEVVSHQLLTHNARWVKGRWRINSKGTSSTILKEIFEVEKASEEVESDKDLVPLQETFRSQEYKQGSRMALRAEFGRALGRSTIEGVLAEQNYSYGQSRPVLLGLSQRNWRNTLGSFLSRWRQTSRPAQDDHYMVLYSSKSPSSDPVLRPTNSPELDEELRATVLQPLLDSRSRTQELISSELATLLNEQEAEAVGAVFECQCCFSDVTFETMATCTTGTHVVCFRCIQHAVSEALYGQSWGLNIDHERAQVACLAPSSTPCTGCIPHEITRRAVLQSRGGTHSLIKLETRLADDSMRASGAKFVRCPFCIYAEVDDIYFPPQTVSYSLNLSHPMQTLILCYFILCLIPLILMYDLLSSFLSLQPFQIIISNALKILARKMHLAPRFICRNPSCARHSCRLCRAAWRDPHTCHESAALSLRTTVEAARTAALKRTCPKCALAFVKESGCNKMVCVCGYSMCYICRQGLGKKPPPARDNGNIPPANRNPGLGANILGLGGMRREVNADDDEEVAGQGYRHFCQHFRPAGGKCTECDKCDLYRGEDEDEIVRLAGGRAEREWRKSQGKKAQGVGVNGTAIRPDEVTTKSGLEGRIQALANWWIGAVIKC